jgi:hypothetical protein
VEHLGQLGSSYGERIKTNSQTDLDGMDRILTEDEQGARGGDGGQVNERGPEVEGARLGHGRRGERGVAVAGAEGSREQRRREGEVEEHDEERRRADEQERGEHGGEEEGRLGPPPRARPHPVPATHAVRVRVLLRHRHRQQQQLLLRHRRRGANSPASAGHSSHVGFGWAPRLVIRQRRRAPAEPFKGRGGSDADELAAHLFASPR